jgi:hypothetical protein
MLVIGAAEFDEKEITQTIFERCSKFGLVTGVEIRRDDDPYRYDFAIVEMSSEKEASEIVTQLGGTAHGFSVVMQICHGRKDARGLQTLH